MKTEMVQTECVHDAKSGGFVISFYPKRNRWIRYGGRIGNKWCEFCHGFFVPGQWYYKSAGQGPLCEGHALFMLGAKRDDLGE